MRASHLGGLELLVLVVDEGDHSLGRRTPVIAGEWHAAADRGTRAMQPIAELLRPLLPNQQTFQCGGCVTGYVPFPKFVPTHVTNFGGTTSRLVARRNHADAYSRRDFEVEEHFTLLLEPWRR